VGIGERDERDAVPPAEDAELMVGADAVALETAGQT
jgi:hypothetical protein